jgi:hypothetical protein
MAAVAALCVSGCGGNPLVSVVMQDMETTFAAGFPTSWYGYPLDTGSLSYVGLDGTVSVTNAGGFYSEVLFILGYLPTGDCTSGLWPSTTPEYGPPGIVPIGNLIVKAPSAGTFTATAHLTLPGGFPISNCLLLGLNGGALAQVNEVTATSDLTLTYSTEPDSPAQRLLFSGNEFCFGQNWGCQGATTDDTLSFAAVQMITAPERLVALFGNVSDSTFDGSSMFGAPPTGAWTASNDFYIYHAGECAALGADATTGVAGPADFYHQVPADAVHLLGAPASGTGIGAQAVPVFQTFDDQLAAGDCLVMLFGVQGGGAFDCETQVRALVQ